MLVLSQLLSSLVIINCKCSRPLIITGVLAIIVAIVAMIVLLVLFLRKSKATMVSHPLWAGKYQIIVHFLSLANIPTPLLRWNTTGITVVGSETGIPVNDSYHLQAPWGLPLGDNNTLYIADSNNQRVQKYLPGASFRSGGAKGRREGAEPPQNLSEPPPELFFKLLRKLIILSADNVAIYRILYCRGFRSIFYWLFIEFNTKSTSFLAVEIQSLT